MEDSDDEEDDTAERMEDCGAAPQTPPTGFVYAPRPSLESEEKQRMLCGRMILAAHILHGATGWFMGRVHNFGAGPAWKQPDATHIVKYERKHTGTEHGRSRGVWRAG